MGAREGTRAPRFRGLTFSSTLGDDFRQITISPFRQFTGFRGHKRRSRRVRPSLPLHADVWSKRFPRSLSCWLRAVLFAREETSDRKSGSFEIHEREASPFGLQSSTDDFDEDSSFFSSEKQAHASFWFSIGEDTFPLLGGRSTSIAPCLTDHRSKRLAPYFRERKSTVLPQGEGVLGGDPFFIFS